MFIGQLGKYVPGMVWAFAAQIELAREYDVPRRRSASATAVSVAVTLATGLIVAAIALPLTSHSAAPHYWWVLACAPLLLVALYPPLLGAALDFVLKLARQPPLERRVSLPGLLAAWAGPRSAGPATACNSGCSSRTSAAAAPGSCCSRSARTRSPGRSASCS